MTINEVIRKELTTFELTELQRIMEAVERHSYLTSGYKHLCGGYAEVEVFEIDKDGDWDEETDADIDLIEYQIETGICEEGGQTLHKSCHTISRKLVGDTKMTLEEKLKVIEKG